MIATREPEVRVVAPQGDGLRTDGGRPLWHWRDASTSHLIGRRYGEVPPIEEVKDDEKKPHD